MAPITIVVPQAEGSLADKLTRALAPALSRTAGAPVVVENRPGGQGVAGSQYVAIEAPADGRTLLMTSLTNLSSFAVMVKDRRFDPLADLTPVLGFAEARLLLGSGPTHPWKTFAGMVDYAKMRPRELCYGASSSSNRLQTALLLAAKGVVAVYRPFDATGDYQQSIANGHPHIGLMPESAAVNWGERIRYIAQTGDVRSASFPDVPTFGELDLPNIKGVTYTLSVRAGTPADTVQALNDAVSNALAQPLIAGQFKAFTLDILRQTPEQARTNLGAHVRFLSTSAKEAGVAD